MNKRACTDRQGSKPLVPSGPSENDNTRWMDVHSRKKWLDFHRYRPISIHHQMSNALFRLKALGHYGGYKIPIAQNWSGNGVGNHRPTKKGSTLPKKKQTVANFKRAHDDQPPNFVPNSQTQINHLLGAITILKNMSSSVGMMKFPYMMERIPIFSIRSQISLACAILQCSRIAYPWKSGKNVPERVASHADWCIRVIHSDSSGDRAWLWVHPLCSNLYFSPERIAITNVLHKDDGYSFAAAVFVPAIRCFAHAMGSVAAPSRDQHHPEKPEKPLVGDLNWGYVKW